VLKQGCATAFERLEIEGFIVQRARLPTPREAAKPFAGQGAHGCLVCLALVALLLVVDLRPKGRPGGCRRPRHNCLAPERRTLEAPGDPSRLAAAFRPGRQPCILLECLGSRVAFPLFAKGHEEARGKDGTGAWPGVNQRAVRRVLRAWRAGGIEVGNGVPGAAELGHEGGPQEGRGGMTPSAVGRATALLIAAMRGVMPAAARPWGGRKPRSSVGRRASCAAWRVGQ
jgi:hypothetical protein